MDNQFSHDNVGNAEAFEKLSDAFQTALGHRLFTASYTDPDTQEGTRIYSSHPSLYPCGGRHEINANTAWAQTIANQAIYVANHPNAFDKTHFINLEDIVAQGFGAVINVPVVMDGQVLGTLNLLDYAGAYADKARIRQAAEALRPLSNRAYQAYLNL